MALFELCNNLNWTVNNKVPSDLTLRIERRRKIYLKIQYLVFLSKFHEIFFGIGLQRVLKTGPPTEMKIVPESRDEWDLVDVHLLASCPVSMTVIYSRQQCLYGARAAQWKH